MKKIFALILACLLLFSACSTTNDPGTTPAPGAQTVTINPAAGFEKGSGTQADPYIISTPEELMHLQISVNEQANTDYLRAWFRLEKDIDLGGSAWRAIGWTTDKQENPFKGVFDGAGHTISNFHTTLEQTEDIGFRYMGLFFCLEGQISNLTVDRAYLHGDHINDVAGSIVAKLGFNGKVENCAAGSNCDLSGATVGGIVGDSYGEIRNCASAASVTGAATTGHAGGIAGFHWKGALENCANSGTVVGMQNAGGIAGSLMGCALNCANSGSVNGAKAAGGVVGNLLQNPTANEHNFTDLSLANCSNAGTVESDQTAGGVIGHLSISGVGEITVNNCSNAGNIMGLSNLGGIIGSVTSRAAARVNLLVCANSGDLTALPQMFTTLGGIVGTLTCSSGEQIELVQCTNEGTLSSDTGYAGGILGAYSGVLAGAEDTVSLTFSTCSNSGAVSGGSRGTGGIAGFVSGKNPPSVNLRLDHCVNNASVTAMAAGGIAGGMVGVLEPTHASALLSYCTNTGAIATLEAELSEADEAFGFHVPLGGMIGLLGLSSVHLDPAATCTGGAVVFEACQNQGSLVQNDDGQIFHLGDTVGLAQMGYQEK